MPSVKPDLRQQTVLADQLARYLCCLTGGRLGVHVDKQLGAACADGGELTEPIADAIRHLVTEERRGRRATHGAAAPSRAIRSSPLHRIAAGVICRSTTRSASFTRESTTFSGPLPDLHPAPVTIAPPCIPPIGPPINSQAHRCVAVVIGVRWRLGAGRWGGAAAGGSDGDAIVAGPPSFVGDQESGDAERDGGKLLADLVIDARPGGDVPLVDHRVEQVDPRRRRAIERAEGQNADGRERLGMLAPGARSSLSDVPELLRGLRPDQIAGQLADRPGRPGSEATEFLGHGRQVVDDVAYAPARAGSRLPERALRHAINERGGREKRVAQLAGNSGTQVRALDNLHGALYQSS